MTTLVTGATGFLGSAVARQLIAAGHTVRVLTRAGSDTRNIDDLDVERALGDLTDPASLGRAVAGCDTLFHVAADYRLWVPDPSAIYRANVDGTRDLLRAASAAGVARIVYTSSVAALGLNADGTPADETTPVRESQMIGHYKRSKFLAEQAVLTLVAEEGVPAVIVNPSAPVGPRDVKPTPTGRIIVDFATGRMPAYVDTGLNLVHVDDCAAGHLRALEAGEIGERYILGGENLTLRAILERLAPLVGRPAPKIRLPHGPLGPLAWSSEMWARLTGVEPRLTRDNLRMARKLMFFSSEKAERALGFKARPTEQALADAVDWFRAMGYLARR